MDNNLWYKDTVLYEISVRAFMDGNGDGRGDLRGLSSKLDYLQDLGIGCIWLMPFYPSPLKDDGYDISDYCDIDPSFGNLEDFRILVEAAHVRGIRIITDLVMNHTSDQHPWFRSARADRNTPYRDYYVWSDSDRVYSEARIIFLDSETSNWSWDDQARQYYWHRFYSSQPDLNFDNLKVQEEMLNIARFWLDLGIDGFRADAVPYLFEREGTSCENLPETHAYLKKLRAYMDQHYPGRILLCEANQWPEDVRRYFGDGDEFHMGFDFPIMPRIFMALKKGRTDDLLEISRRTPMIPPNCQWCTFLRNHDELTLEMVSAEEREWMWEKYAPEPRMRLNLGIRRRLAPLLDNDRRKIELANSLLFTLPGSPIIYYGDEIGMGDNISLDDRNGVRTPMQWADSRNAGFSDAAELYAPVTNNSTFPLKQVNVDTQRRDPSSLFHTIRRIIAARKEHLTLGRGDLEWLDPHTPAVAAYARNFEMERLIILNNLSGSVQSVKIKAGGQSYLDILNNRSLSAGTDQLEIQLQPYEFLWLQETPRIG